MKVPLKGNLKICTETSVLEFEILTLRWVLQHLSTKAKLDASTSTPNLSAVVLHPSVKEHMKGKEVSSSQLYQNFHVWGTKCWKLCRFQTMHTLQGGSFWVSVQNYLRCNRFVSLTSDSSQKLEEGKDCEEIQPQSVMLLLMLLINPNKAETRSVESLNVCAVFSSGLHFICIFHYLGYPESPWIFISINIWKQYKWGKGSLGDFWCCLMEVSCKTPEIQGCLLTAGKPI